MPANLWRIFWTWCFQGNKPAIDRIADTPYNEEKLERQKGCNV